MGKAVGVAEQRDALTELVQRYVGRGRSISTREFAERAIDPATGRGPSKSLVGKIAAGQNYDITPELVSAIAVGLGIDREIAAAAAHFQVIGYRDAELKDGPPAALLLHLSKDPADAELGRAVADQWDAEEARHSEE
jgi:hypothetical protein